MQNTMLGKLVAVILLVIMSALFIFFYVNLNRVDKKLVEVQNSLLADATKTQEVINFFNANMNEQAN